MKQKTKTKNKLIKAPDFFQETNTDYSEAGFLL